MSRATLALLLVACGGVDGALEVPGGGASISTAPAAPRSCGEPPMPSVGPLAFTPSQYDFAAGGTKTFVVTNTGDARTDGMIVDLVSSMEFAVPMGGLTCRSILEPHATCTITIGFRPLTPGPKTAWVTVASASGGRTSACLSGTGN